MVILVGWSCEVRKLEHVYNTPGVIDVTKCKFGRDVTTVFSNLEEESLYPPDGLCKDKRTTLDVKSMYTNTASAGIIETRGSSHGEEWLVWAKADFGKPFVHVSCGADEPRRV